MKKTLFGTLPSGEAVHLYTLDSGKMQANVIDYGCRIQAILFNGVDFAGGYDTLESYLADDSSQGAFVGRVANRIKDARFTLNGKTYQLPANDGKNHLHGVFGQTVWNAKIVDDCTLVFTHHSAAAEEGYPGNMNLEVTYHLDGTALELDYKATADEDTPINLTNHTYFNLGGIGSGSVLEQEMQVNADEITLVDDELIPIGKRMTVCGTPYDFHEYQPIGARFNEQVDGYDTNFWLNKSEPVTLLGKELYRAGAVRSDLYQMDCYTDLPCMQIYSGNFLGSGPDFKYGVKQARQHAICLETQFEPDAINHGEGILRVGETYHYTTVYVFSRR